MKDFRLLVNGEDIDTGLYEYYPYVDKVITASSETRRIIRELRADRQPSGWQDYVYARYCIGVEDTNKRAIEAAYEASQAFRAFSLSRRKKIMAELRRLLLVHKQELIKLMVIEGHPQRLAEWEFLGMEQAYQSETISFYRSQLLQNVGQSNGETFYLARKPDGVLCVSPPKNAACSNSLLAAFALLGGNAIVVKPPLHAPLSTIFLWRYVVFEAARSQGAPPGIVNIILGNSKLITDEWLESPLVSDLLYFGDSDQGLEIGLRTFQAGKKPLLELSGNDMLIVWKDANLKGAVSSLLDGFLGSTQICMLPKKGIIHADIYDQFEKQFVEAAQALKISLPSDPATCLSPVGKIKEFRAALSDALENGATLLCGGEQVNHVGQSDKNGMFITPAVVRIESLEQALTMRCVREENFFPLIPLIRVSASTTINTERLKDDSIFKQMVKLVNSNAYGLRVSVWVHSEPVMYRFAKQIETGGLLRINTRHVGFSPFLSSHGGTGKTGGPYGEMNYVWQKTTHLQGITVRNLARSTKLYA